MPRARNIKPGFFTNELLAELPPLTRLLYIGLWTEADREGRLEDRPRRLKMRLFPGDDFDVEEAMQALAAAGFIVRYVVEGVQYVQIVAWAKHQRPHYKEAPSTIPEPKNYPELGSTMAKNDDRGSSCGKVGVLGSMIGGQTQGFGVYHRGSNPGLAPSDTGYLIPDTGFLDAAVQGSKSAAAATATKTPQPEIDWSEPDPTKLIRAKIDQFAETWLEPGNVPRAANAAEREFAQSEASITEWLGKIQVSFDRWAEHHAVKRFRDRKHFVPHLERWFYDGDYSRRPPGQQKAVLGVQEPRCAICGDVGMVYPVPPQELQGEARLDWLAANGKPCFCGAGT
jgi:hypothetical protein